MKDTPPSDRPVSYRPPFVPDPVHYQSNATNLYCHVDCMFLRRPVSIPISTLAWTIQRGLNSRSQFVGKEGGERQD